MTITVPGPDGRSAKDGTDGATADDGPAQQAPKHPGKRKNAGGGTPGSTRTEPGQQRTPGGELPEPTRSGRPSASPSADGGRRPRETPGRPQPSPERSPKGWVPPATPQSPRPGESATDAPRPTDPTSSPARGGGTPPAADPTGTRPGTNPPTGSTSRPSATSAPTAPRAPVPSQQVPPEDAPSSPAAVPPTAATPSSHAGSPAGATSAAAERTALTGPVASRPPVSDPPGRSPAADQSVRLTAPAPWASGQVTDARGFSEARSAARSAGDGTHLVEVNLPGRSWSELDPDGALLRHAAATKARVVYDVPLTIDDATLGEVASGAHDAAWRAFGQALAPTRRTNVIRLRLPENANQERAKLAFRRAATLVRAGSPLTKIEWSAPVGTTPRTAAATWPGADVVDIVGLHVPATGTWTHVLADDGGLLDWTDWASRTGKPVALHWQLGARTDAAWVRNLNSWMQVLVSQRRMSYETMTQVGTPDAAAAAAYRALW